MLFGPASSRSLSRAQLAQIAREYRIRRQQQRFANVSPLDIIKGILIASHASAAAIPTLVQRAWNHIQTMPATTEQETRQDQLLASGRDRGQERITDTREPKRLRTNNIVSDQQQITSFFNPTSTSNNKRRKIRHHPMDTGENNNENNDNQPMALARAAGAGVGGGSIGGETPLDPYGLLSKGFPNTWTMIHTWRSDDTILLDASAQSAVYRIKLNQPFNILSNIAANNMTGEASGAGIAAWYNIMKAYYQYFHVCRTNWKIFIRMLEEESSSTGTTTNVSNKSVEVSWLYAGSDEFFTATNIAPHQIRHWKGLHGPIPLRAPQNVGDTRDRLTLESVWYPGMFEREIRDDTEAKIWTAIDTNVTLLENLNIIFARIDPAATTVTISISIDCDFFVQWKDLARTYQWPIWNFETGNNSQT